MSGEKPSQYQLEKAVDIAYAALGVNESPTQEQIDRFNGAVEELRKHYPLPAGLSYMPRPLPTHCPTCGGKPDGRRTKAVGPGIRDNVICNNYELAST